MIYVMIYVDLCYLQLNKLYLKLKRNSRLFDGRKQFEPKILTHITLYCHINKIADKHDIIYVQYDSCMFSDLSELYKSND